MYSLMVVVCSLNILGSIVFCKAENQINLKSYESCLQETQKLQKLNPDVGYVCLANPRIKNGVNNEA